ncbi:site-specific integrase [Vibrio metschnikovii]
MEQHDYRLDFISLAGLLEYQSWLTDQDYKQTSRARMLSALRRLFQYLHREKVRSDDPSALLVSLNCHSVYRKISVKSKSKRC